MFNMKNSDLLEKLIFYAKTFDDKGVAPLTAERYLAGVLCLLSGEVDMEIDNDQKLKLIAILPDGISPDGKEFKEAKNALITHIRESTDSSLMDVIYIQQRSLKAQEIAGSRGLQEVTPEILLECILKEPSDFIKEHILKDTSSGSEESTKDDIEEFVKKKFQEALKKQEKDADEKDGAEKTEKDTVLSEEEPADKKPRSTVDKLTKRVQTIRDGLGELVFGQDNAISVLTTGLFQAALLSWTDKGRTRPVGTFLFAGPPGVGKTYLVKSVVKLLNMEKKFRRFDMSEYADSLAYLDLIGYGDNYKNPKEGLLTSFVRQNSSGIILFDEIEKAHITTIHLFLQILDEGFLTDNKTNERVSFKETMIFFTTNAGKELYNAPDAYDFSGTPRKVILKALQKDTNPINNQPLFPAAICSRFSSGNVVMFNHMSASSLCKIAQTEIEHHASNFEKEYGIRITLDRDVYAALLFAEGGNADARSLRGRAERFFDDEIFELFRFLASEDHKGDISKLESINFNAKLPADKEISSLFRNDVDHNVLMLSSEEVIKECESRCDGVRIIGVRDIASAKQSLASTDISFAVIDMPVGTQGEKEFINIEDVDSLERDVFRYIREKYADLPVYILQRDGRLLSKEEQRSFLSEGVRGFIGISEGNDSFEKDISRISGEIYQQSSMRKLASSNNLISFETGQRIADDEKTAEITLFDFKLSTAVDAEDTQNIMSNVSKPNVKFDRIIGAENAKDELRFFIEYLKDPRKFVESGLRAPRGVLLYGPPGTGKTLLAKAVAAEAGVTFISAEGNQFIKRYVGQGKDELHNIFSVARKYSPSILFIDEFEAIAKERRGGDNAAANGEDVLTALLTEMDGFNTDITRPVFVLAATNFDITPGSDKSLDQALLRRFDSKICVDLPNKQERIRFIKMKCSEGKAFDISETEIGNIAMRSAGMSLADLDSIMELSLRTAVKKADKRVTDEVLDEAFEIFIGGEEKKWDVAQLERTARHEAGHAFLCWQSGETPSYVTVVARGDHGGYMQHADNEGKAIFTKDELLARIRTSLGGRAAELVYYGEKDGVSTGAAGDLASATGIARQIICSYGMYEDFGLAVIERQAALTGELSSRVNEAINRILSEQMRNAVSLIEANKPSIDALVQKLMNENHLTGDEIKRIFEENS